MRTVSFSEARNNLKSVLDRVVDDADVTIIHRRDSDDVVVMSLAEWNSWQETYYLLSSPVNAKRLLEGVARLNAGHGEYHELIEPGIRGVHEERATYRSRSKRKKPAANKLAAKKRARK